MRGRAGDKAHLTLLDFSNAFNTVDRRDIAQGLRQYAPVLYRAGGWHTTAVPVLCSARPSGDRPSPRHRVSDRVTRWDRSCSPSEYAHCSETSLPPSAQIDSSWHISTTSTSSPDDLALDQKLAFFDEPQPSILAGHSSVGRRTFTGPPALSSVWSRLTSSFPR
jgi:hypothetical protein